MATLIEAYKMDSGMILSKGNKTGGGSELMKTLKLGWCLAYTCSRKPSNPLRPVNQFYMRWTFCNMIQCPSLAHFSNSFLAGSSCPYPIEMLMNLPFELVISNVAATLSTSGVGSTPGNNTKNIGVVGAVSMNVSIMLNGGCST